MRDYMRIWKENRELLEQVRDEDIRQADTAESILMFDQSFKIALRDLPLRESSGLVEWQKLTLRWLARA